MRNIFHAAVIIMLLLALPLSGIAAEIVSLPTGVAGTTLRLAADALQTMHEISAYSFAHEETLAAPLAFAVRDTEQEDAVHLLLLFPNGTGLDAAGRTGDVQTRGGDFRSRPRLQYTGVVFQQQRRTDTQRQIDEQQKRMEALQRELATAQSKSSVEAFMRFAGDDPGVAGEMQANSVIIMGSKPCKNCSLLQAK